MMSIGHLYANALALAISFYMTAFLEYLLAYFGDVYLVYSFNIYVPKKPSENILLTPNQMPKTPQEAALYHLQGLAASLPHVNFSEILAKYQQRPVAGATPKLSVAEPETPVTPGYPVHGSQPYFNQMRSAQSQMNGLQSDYLGNSSLTTEYPRMTSLEKNSRPTNRLAQSLWHLPTDRNANPATDPMQIGYGQQVVAASQNWDDFRMATLRRGLERIRGPSTSSALSTPRNPMHSQVSASLGNLHTVLHRNPNIIVEEMTVGSSGSLADSFLDRESNILGGRSDDLGDVLSRSIQGAAVSNITLTRSPSSGFGLILVDGEVSTCWTAWKLLFKHHFHLKCLLIRTSEVLFTAYLLSLRSSDECHEIFCYIFLSYKLALSETDQKRQ